MLRVVSYHFISDEQNDAYNDKTVQPRAAVINTDGKSGKSNECCMLF